MIETTSNVLAGDPRFAALAKLTARLLNQDVAKVLTNLVDLVDPKALPFLIDQFHVADIDAGNSEAAQRNLVRSAIELHRHKGTPWAVVEALRLMGAEASVIEWFANNGQPGTFAVAADVFDLPVDDALYQTALRVIDRAKNARSHLTGLQLNTATQGASPFVAAVSTVSIVIHVYPKVQVI